MGLYYQHMRRVTHNLLQRLVHLSVTRYCVSQTYVDGLGHSIHPAKITGQIDGRTASRMRLALALRMWLEAAVNGKCPRYAPSCT